jgi:hypothetical protein
LLSAFRPPISLQNGARYSSRHLPQFAAAPIARRRRSYPLATILKHFIRIMLLRYEVQAENLAPHVVAALARQIRALAMTPPDGVTLVPSEALHEIYADIDGPGELFI